MIRRVSQHPIVLLVVLQVAVSLPYFLYGFGYVREEWTFLGDAEAGGSWHAALESTRQARPVVAALYAAIYGFAEYPMVWHVLLVLLNAGVAVMLFRLLRLWFGATLALSVSTSWVLLPTHMTLDHWLAATNITLSLVLLLIGLERLTVAVDRSEAGWAAVLALTAASLAYDAVIPVAMVGAAVLPLLRTRRLGWWWFRCGIAPLAIGIYVAVQFRDRGSDPVSPGLAFGQNLAYGITTVEFLQVGLVCGVLGGLATIGVRTFRTRRIDAASAMALVGLVVMAVGVVPFATTGFDAQFVGLGDRMNMIISIGAAMVLVGVLGQLARWRVLLLVAAVTIVVSALPTRLDVDQDWAVTSEYALSAARQVLEQTSDETVSLQRNRHVVERLPGTRSDLEVSRILRSGAAGRRIEVIRDADGVPIATESAVLLPL